MVILQRIRKRKGVGAGRWRAWSRVYLEATQEKWRVALPLRYFGRRVRITFHLQAEASCLKSQALVQGRFTSPTRQVVQRVYKKNQTAPKTKRMRCAFLCLVLLLSLSVPLVHAHAACRGVIKDVFLSGEVVAPQDISSQTRNVTVLITWKAAHEASFIHFRHLMFIQ